MSHPHRQLAPRNASDDAAVAALARGAAAGDSRAWEALFRRYTPALRGTARGFRLTPSEIDDVVQNTWLAAFRHIRSLQKPEAIGAWLVVTARRESLRSRQRCLREVLTNDPVDAAEPDTASTEELVIDAERRHALHAALRRLTDRQRSVLGALLSAETSSYLDLSSKLAIPVGSIGPTRDRAIARLRHDPRLGKAMREPDLHLAS
jgi:RNA polymerase sigma factor (sigma-70 family)